MQTVWYESAGGRSGLRHLATAAALYAVGTLLPGSANAESMEERLRTQLRSTTQLLQRLQSEQAQLNAAKSAAEAQRDATQKELESLRGQLAKAKSQAEQLAAQQSAVQETAQTQVAASQSQAAKVRSAYDELLALARTKETERAALARNLAERDGEAKACAAKNRDMYQAAKDILKAYESISTGDILAIRQPFAGAARVKFEEQAQEFGDRLYDAQVPAAPTQP